MSTQSLTPQALMAKAERACLSARTLLDMGDGDGAANRAYYAMFDAARAALLGISTEVDSSTIGRTHSGLIGAFGQYLVKLGKVDKALGRSLNRAHEIRQIADYNGESVSLEDVREMLGQAEHFIAAMRSIVWV